MELWLSVPTSGDEDTRTSLVCLKFSIISSNLHLITRALILHSASFVTKSAAMEGGKKLKIKVRKQSYGTRITLKKTKTLFSAIKQAQAVGGAC